MIYKRGRICWYRFKFSLKLETGERQSFLIQKSARTGNSRKASEVEEEHRRALRLGLSHPLDPWPKPPAPEAPRLREFTKQFLAYSKSHTKPGTSQFYSVAVNRILLFSPIADKLLTEITGEMVSKYIQWRQAMKSGNATVTINGELRTLRRIFNLAHEWGMLPATPTIHELAGATCRERVLSFQEEAKYLSRAGETLRDLTVLAVDTGLRPNSELFPLLWSNVWLESSDDAVNGYLHVQSGKTDSAVRNIPLTPRAQEALKARKAVAGASRYVFPGPGRSGHITTVQHAHERTIRDADLDQFEFYCWRHTFGTRCAESGMDKFTLARLMGHSSPRVAERYYVHVTESHVTAGFGKFVDYQAAKMLEAFPQQTDRHQ